MRKQNCSKRGRWKHKVVRRDGLVHGASLSGEAPYWREGQYIELARWQVNTLAKAAAEMQRMYIEATEWLLQQEDRLADFGIPKWAFPYIRRSWDTDGPSLYGRFDISWSGKRYTLPKLLEYNAQTPTSLLEATVVQWNWLQEAKLRHKNVTQWNNAYEALVLAWQRNMAVYKRQTGRDVSVIHLVYSNIDTSGEDMVNVGTMADAALEAGFKVKVIELESMKLYTNSETIGIGGEQVDTGYYHDADGLPIEVAFMLWPWEHVLAAKEGKGKTCFWNSMQPDGTVWMEPLWKLIWSSKAFLPILYQLFPDSPYLLPAYFEGRVPTGALPNGYAKKPVQSREGSNVCLVDARGKTLADTAGPYGAEGYILQELHTLPKIAKGQYLVLGVWIIDGEPAGLGCRVGDLVTDNRSGFMPHAVVANRSKRKKRSAKWNCKR